MADTQRFSTQWGGKELIIETGRYAAPAGGSCTVQYGETVVLATATMSEGVRSPDLSYFPLMVDYEEKLYAAGRIKGSRFIKREGRPTDNAVLTSRFIDRALRPLFNKRIRNDVQVITTVLAFDEQNDPDIVALIAASCALHISDVPWAGPIAVSRAGLVDGNFVLNPSYEERNGTIFDLDVAGTAERVIMVEANCNEAPEDQMAEAFRFCMDHLQTPIDLIEEVRAAVGKEKRDVLAPKTDETKEALAKKEEIQAMAEPFIRQQTEELFFGAPKATKSERRQAKKEIKERLEAHLIEEGIEEDVVGYGLSHVDDVIESVVSEKIIQDGMRVDGRALDEVRQLDIEVGVLPRVHGTGHFARGETQVLSVVTLGAPGDEQVLDGMEQVGTQRFMHHYNFPPFSVGEVKPLRGASRRDIGHGALAEKAIMPLIPDKESFPYTIRVVSEVFSSNGSSSMASTCATALALMDAGVPIQKPVAGIAIGLASNKDMSAWKIVTDIQDLEDGTGGMDFKVTGTRDGITAIQLDTKTIGLTYDMVVETLERGRLARHQILDQMTSVIPEARAELSEHAPRILKMHIEPDQIRDVIGSGGKVINEIISETGVGSIDIEDDGLVMITAVSAESGQKAKEWIEQLTFIPEIGAVYDGVVTRIEDFGAFVKIAPNSEGLVHISAMAPFRIDSVKDVVKDGQEVKVKVVEIDSMNRINLSMKDVPGYEAPESAKSKGQGRPTNGNGRNGKRPNGRGPRGKKQS